MSKITSSLSIIRFDSKINWQDKFWCVYAFKFEGSQKIYIGSTIQGQWRIAAHFAKLKNNAHSNRHLQSAFDKHGADKCYAIIVEKLDSSADPIVLRQRERYWISLTRASDRRYGYNMEKDPVRKIGQKGVNRKEYTVYDPNGNLVTITDLKQFCVDRDLDYTRMLNAIKGRSLEYQGWKKEPNRKHGHLCSYRFRSPDGQIHEGNNVIALCRKHGLARTAMYSVLHGNRHHHKGWTKA